MSRWLKASWTANRTRRHWSCSRQSRTKEWNLMPSLTTLWLTASLEATRPNRHRRCFQATQDKGVEHDVGTYTKVVGSFMKNNHTQEALKVFQAIQDKGVEPNVVTYTSWLRASCRVLDSRGIGTGRAGQRNGTNVVSQNSVHAIKCQLNRMATESNEIVIQIKSHFPFLENNDLLSIVASAIRDFFLVNYSGRMLRIRSGPFVFTAMPPHICSALRFYEQAFVCRIAWPFLYALFSSSS